MTNKVEIQCPCCKGRGKVKIEIKEPPEIRWKAAYDLKQAGATLESIAKKFGWRHPSAAAYHISRYKQFLAEK